MRTKKPPRGPAYLARETASPSPTSHSIHVYTHIPRRLYEGLRRRGPPPRARARRGATHPRPIFSVHLREGGVITGSFAEHSGGAGARARGKLRCFARGRESEHFGSSLIRETERVVERFRAAIGFTLRVGGLACLAGFEGERIFSSARRLGAICSVRIKEIDFGCLAYFWKKCGGSKLTLKQVMGR